MKNYSNRNRSFPKVPLIFVIQAQERLLDGTLDSINECGVIRIHIVRYGQEASLN